MEKETRPVSKEAVRLYRESEEKIALYIRQKLETEARLGHSSLPVKMRFFIQGICDLFCKTVTGLYEFGLYNQLEREYAWFLSVLTSRGMPQECFTGLLKMWDMGVHSFIKTSEANELVAPFVNVKACSAGLNKEEKKEQPALLQDFEQFISFLLEKNRDKALQKVLSLQKQGQTKEAILTEMFPFVLNKIGTLWEEGKISVVDQHVATDICNYVLMKISEDIIQEEKIAAKILVACIPGETHEMGAEILEVFLEQKGWDVQSMGHIAPHNDMIQAILEIKPDIMFFSICMIANLSAARTLLKDLRELIPQTKIVLGGKAALAAQKELLSFADAVAKDFAEGHQIALELIKQDA